MILRKIFHHHYIWLSQGGSGDIGLRLHHVQTSEGKMHRRARLQGPLLICPECHGPPKSPSSDLYATGQGWVIQVLMLLEVAVTLMGSG